MTKGCVDLHNEHYAMFTFRNISLAEKSCWSRTEIDTIILKKRKDLKIMKSPKSNKRKKKESSDSSAAKQSRNRITLEGKLEIIKLFEKGASKAQIGRQKNLPDSTVRSILSKKEKTKIQGAHTAEYGALKLTKARSRAMLEMERLLFIWIEDCNRRNTPISLIEVQFKGWKISEAIFNLVSSSKQNKTRQNKTIIKTFRVSISFSFLNMGQTESTL